MLGVGSSHAATVGEAYARPLQKTGEYLDQLDQQDIPKHALFAWGSPEQIATRVAEHLDAGADHVCMQIVHGAPMAGTPDSLRQAWRDLAPLTQL
jgi:alkanesulfonate monooxygenase SsuD/methylene tetrahydromethanopterin reductase-like flavin-dependent oxidoreductase (luciferase family)